MKIGMILLSNDGYYINNSGSLPSRPKWDKQFLVDMCRDKVVLCSSNTMIDLPPSLFKVVKTITTDANVDYDINLGINTFKLRPDLLIVTRSLKSLGQGKYFKLDGYIRILKREELELWTLNKKH